MLMQLLQFPFVGDRGQALEEWERLVRQYEAQVQTRFRTRLKQQYWHTAHKIQNGGGMLV